MDDGNGVLSIDQDGGGDDFEDFVQLTGFTFEDSAVDDMIGNEPAQLIV